MIHYSISVAITGTDWVGQIHKPDETGGNIIASERPHSRSPAEQLPYRYLSPWCTEDRLLRAVQAGHWTLQWKERLKVTVVPRMI